MMRQSIDWPVSSGSRNSESEVITVIKRRRMQKRRRKKMKRGK